MGEQYETVVVRRNPEKERRRRILIIFSIVLAVMTSAAGGFYYNWQRLSHAEAEADRLTLRYAKSERELSEARQQLANLSTGSEVDRQAVEEIRSLVREQQQTIANQGEEIAFYKGLMAPTDKEKGLSIRSWELYPGAMPGEYEFKLTVQQLAVKHRLLKGHVRVQVVSREGEGEQVHELSQLSQQIESERMTLRFKYFQTIAGQMVLPEGLEPVRIDVFAEAQSPKRVKVEKHFAWTVRAD